MPARGGAWRRRPPAAAPLPHARGAKPALLTSENEAIAGDTDAFAIDGNGHAERQYLEVERRASGGPT
jgi:hypothetical protein